MPWTAHKHMVVEAPRSKGVVATLNQMGIYFPSYPHGKALPGAYLARGESDIEHLVAREAHFIPHFGRDWLYGVFLGDNERILAQGKIFYVLSTKLVIEGSDWLIADSKEMERRIHKIASELDFPFTLNTYGSYAEAAERIYKTHPIYHPEEGMATIPWRIPLEKVELILVDKSILDEHKGKIAQSLRGKIIPLEYNP